MEVVWAGVEAWIRRVLEFSMKTSHLEWRGSVLEVGMK